VDHAGASHRARQCGARYADSRHDRFS
jgi:hypothetical protein